MSRARRNKGQKRHMKILDYLDETWLVPELEATDKESVLRELATVLVQPSGAHSVEEILSVLLEREKLESTGIGEGVAIPHGRFKGLGRFFISFGRSSKGVDFDSIDRKPTKLIFLVMAPENSAASNLKLLGRIVTLLKDASFKKRLMETASRRELFEIIAEEDRRY